MKHKPNFCKNHPESIAWYTAGKFFFCKECRQEAVYVCQREWREIRENFDNPIRSIGFRRRDQGLRESF